MLRRQGSIMLGDGDGDGNGNGGVSTPSSETSFLRNIYMFPNKKKKEIPSAVAGAMAGAFAKTAVAPIERVKLLLQLQSSLDNVKYDNKSPWRIARTIYQDQGLLAFWRGNTPNVIRQAGTSGLNFMLMDWYKNMGKRVLPEKSSAIHSFLSGGLAGATATTFLYPVEFLRTRLAMDIGSGATRRYRGMRDVLVSTLRSDGIAGLYQGYGVALVGVFLYRAMHLGGYDVLKRDVSWTERLAVAQIVSLTAGTLCYPIDSVRRRMMMQAGLATRVYRNSWHCFRTILTREGYRGFFLGLGPNLVRSFGGALLLVAYDLCKQL